jgi:hypothetical protein
MRDKTTILSTTYVGHPAFMLSNGRTEAVIVPALSGRVMRYALVGGESVLWNHPSPQFKPDEWHNYGGDKAWPALQSTWGMYLKNGGWPPHTTWDGDPHKAEVVGSDTLRVRGPVMKGFGVRSTREYSFDASGHLIINTTFRRELATTDASQVAAWNVTQIPGEMEAVFLALNPSSPYKDNHFWFGAARPAEARAEVLPGNILKFTPTTKGGYKLGADSPVSTMVAVRKGLAFIIHAEKKTGEYPEGVQGAGFPVTIWNGGSDEPKMPYVEMEMMSPLTLLAQGESLTHTVTWQLAPLVSTDINAFETHRQIARLLLS